MKGGASEGNLIGSVPAISCGDIHIAESTAIVRFVSETRKPNATLYPADQKKKALINQYLDWHHNNVRKSVMGVLTLKVFSK